VTTQVRLFIIPASPPGAPPQPGRTFSVDLPFHDGILEAVRERIVADGFRVRSVSFGPAGVVAYAEEK
jgi:hypothetical protein